MTNKLSYDLLKLANELYDIRLHPEQNKKEKEKELLYKAKLLLIELISEK